jgi:hypothetical protein
MLIFSSPDSTHTVSFFFFFLRKCILFFWLVRIRDITTIHSMDFANLVRLASLITQWVL